MVFRVEIEHATRATSAEDAVERTIDALVSGRLQVHVRDVEAPFGELVVPEDRFAAHDRALELLVEALLEGRMPGRLACPSARRGSPEHLVRSALLRVSARRRRRAEDSV